MRLEVFCLVRCTTGSAEKQWSMVACKNTSMINMHIYIYTCTYPKLSQYVGQYIIDIFPRYCYSIPERWNTDILLNLRQDSQLYSPRFGSASWWQSDDHQGVCGYAVYAVYASFHRRNNFLAFIIVVNWRPLQLKGRICLNETWNARTLWSQDISRLFELNISLKHHESCKINETSPGKGWLFGSTFSDVFADCFMRLSNLIQLQAESPSLDALCEKKGVPRGVNMLTCSEVAVFDGPLYPVLPTCVFLCIFCYPRDPSFQRHA